MLKRFSMFVLSIVLGIIFAFPVMADQTQGLFSDKNFEALQKDPLTLFSPVNSCRLKSLIGKQDFDLFRESMALETSEEDAKDYVSISGNVQGLFTIFEGFFRLSKSGKVWIAYLYNDKVHYFTNDETTLKQPPKIMLNWASRFQSAEWIDRSITVRLNNCK